jgi:hypothetical protein
MSVNKHYCQGTHCHTNTTQDRFQKSTGMLRGRYAYFNLDNEATTLSIFCSQGCANDWLMEHTEDIINHRPIRFITERRTSGGYEMKTETHEGWQGRTTTYKTIHKINSQNSQE